MRLPLALIGVAMLLLPYVVVASGMTGCETIGSSGVYSLDSDLVANISPSPCIDIRSDNVRIECNGHRIIINDSHIVKLAQTTQGRKKCPLIYRLDKIINRTQGIAFPFLL